MEQVKTATSRLFVTSVVENKDDLEEKLERSYHVVQNLTAGLSDKDAHDALNNALLKEKGYEDVSVGLLVTILTEPQNAIKCYRDLTLITRDGFGTILTHLSQLVLDRYHRLNDVVRTQLLWLIREMIKNAVCNVDSICCHLMRFAAGGDVSQKNITLIESLLDIYMEYRNWLYKYPTLVTTVVYTYLRLLEDHNAPYLANLRQKEAAFLSSVIRDRFSDVMLIGRDLVRLLQNVARIPEFEQLWKDILLAPKTLCPNFSGVLQLLQMRTSRRFLQSRLTPDMERKLVFLTSQVRFGNHKRYQDWFQRQYLATPESQSLRCDMIRFIVAVIHPTNELLCSDIIPRWAVIGWLLTTCTSTVTVSNSKLALFYDWLFFDSERDNIMNIEPAILVIYHSMRSHPAVSATLLDFLCRIITNFYPPLTDKVRNGIFSSLKQILDKRVLPSLLPLFDNAKLDRELRNMIRETFKEFCVPPAVESSSKMEEFNVQQANKFDECDQPDGRINNTINNHILDNEPAFSDEEDEHPITINPPEDDTDDDDIPLSKVRLKEKVHDKMDDFIFDGPIKKLLVQLLNEKIPNKKPPIVEDLIKEVVDLDVNSELLSSLAKSLCNYFQDEMKKEIFPKIVSEETLTDSISLSFFTIFKHLYRSFKQEDTGKEVLLKLITEMYSVQPNLGYLLLYFLKVTTMIEQKEENTKAGGLKVSIYKEFCQALEKKIDICLYDDLSTCHISDCNLMVWIVPDLYKDFKQQTVNNAQILRVIVSAIDSRQLQDLIYRVLQGHLVMFKSDNLQSLLKATLSWESIEQFFLWQLIQAHDISLDQIMPLVSHLDYKQHSEALSAIVLMLKQEKPTADYIKHLFSRDVRENGDDLVFTIIKYWCEQYMNKVGELVSDLLSTRYPATSPNKRKRSGNKSSISATVPSADQVLSHLDQLRISGEKHDNLGLYNLDTIQRALCVALTNSNDSQKKQFSGLFALAEEEETSSTKGRPPARGRKPANKAANKKTSGREVSESSEESSEEELFVKPKQAKKRKKVMSDSD